LVEINIDDTQVLWPGKYSTDGKLHEVSRYNLPFQIIETINESRATRESKKTNGLQKNLFEIWAGTEGQTFDSGWKNKLIWGDNKFVLSSLLDKFAGKIDLIYIDPPFNVGDDFSFDVEIGNGELTKKPSAIELKAYRDTWGQGTSSYLQMMYDRLVLMKDLLSSTGSIYVHLDAHVGHYVKVMLDEIFGRENFRREIIWVMTGLAGYKALVENFVRAHDVIYYYSKTKNCTFHKEFLPYNEKQLTRFSSVDEKGRRYKPITSTRRLYLDEAKGIPIPDVWSDIVGFHTIQNAKDFVGFPTQKPETLLDRIIKASSNEGDLVADFFCGSGTTLAVAEKLGRRWIGCDLSRFAIHITRKRLLEIEKCKPFEILNLGKYERQIWQTLSFSKNGKDSIVYEYLAFILKLYSAEPLSGGPAIHGRKGKALIHIGAVDAPVTIDEAMNALNECSAVRQTELHILGWEWEMGIHDLIEEAARKLGIKLRLLQIPNDVIGLEPAKETKVGFFDLAYVDAKAKVHGKSVEVSLSDFSIPNTDLIPTEVRSQIKHWSDLVDYWAVDFDFREGRFLNNWSSYRTKANAKLELKATHDYPNHGKYDVLVKVVDIFGIDSSRILGIEV
jgi:adenine-specific DNA-methyltransferase